MYNFFKNKYLAYKFIHAESMNFSRGSKYMKEHNSEISYFYQVSIVHNK